MNTFFKHNFHKHHLKNFSNNCDLLKASDFKETIWIDFTFSIQISDSYHEWFKRTLWALHLSQIQENYIRFISDTVCEDDLDPEVSQKLFKKSVRVI